MNPENHMAKNPLQSLEKKIDSKKIVLGILGLGYVGIPLSLTFLGKGIKVLGFDLDSQKITQLKNGQSYLKHIPADEIFRFVTRKLFEPTDDFSRLGEADGLFICVPTPLTKNREPDLQYIENTARAIVHTLRPGQIILLESTTYPGTTVEVLQPILENKGLRGGRDFALAYSPEREDPGNPTFHTTNTPKIVGGIEPVSTRLASKIYRLALEEVIEVSTTQVAEMAKLLENIFRSVNIAMINEMKMLCHRMGINIWEVIRAASSKPFGFMPFYPGPGLGGHCIPIDPFYLTSKAREFDISTKFIELAGEINTAMPYYVVQRTMEALNERGKALKGAKILILGVAYKKDVDDTRESPSFKLMEILAEKGADIAYNDPHVPSLKPVRRYSFNLQSRPLSAKNLKAADCILVATNHSAYDYGFILQHAQLIVDTRNVFAGALKDNGKKPGQSSLLAKVVMA
jgi:UDP-N-acetyl-D-glucosamine dehydrogenase